MQTITLLALVLLIAATTCKAAPALQRPLADAEYYMKDVDKNVPKLTEQAKKAATLSANEIQAALNQVDWTGQKLNNVIGRLQQLPAGEPAVAALQQRVASRASELLAAQNAFKQAADGRAKLIESAKATIDADSETLEGLSLQIANGTMLQSDPARSVATVRSLPHMIEQRNAIEKKYAPILGEHEGRPLAGVIGGFDSRLESYRREMTRMEDQLPRSIRNDLEQATTIAELGVQRKDARPFTAGGIQQAFGRASINLELLVAIGGENATTKSLQKELTKTQKDIASAQGALEVEILGQNSAPNDLYQGADKAEILAAVEKVWNKSHKSKQVLGMRIPMRAWERRVSWRWALDRFMKEDMSDLQVAILVKGDDKVGHVYYAYLDRDHLAGDKQRIKIADKGEVELYRKFLLENLD